MARAGVWLATLPLLAACGSDPILERAGLNAEEAPTNAATPSRRDSSPPSAAEAGQRRANVGDPQPAGEPGAPLTPGVPEPPKPGIPGSPIPGAPGSPQPAGGSQPAPGVAGEMRPGIPEQPKPGIPTEPKPGAPGSPQPFAGPTVKVRGEVVYAAYKRGKIKITAFDGPHSSRAKTPPKVVGNLELDAIGAFALEVPQGAGRLYLEAVVDEDGDGRPGPLDPHGNADRYPVTVEEEDVEGLVVELKAQAPPPAGGGKGDF